MDWPLAEDSLCTLSYDTWRSALVAAMILLLLAIGAVVDVVFQKSYN
jgi:hypothetical protein